MVLKICSEYWNIQKFDETEYRNKLNWTDSYEQTIFLKKKWKKFYGLTKLHRPQHTQGWFSWQTSLDVRTLTLDWEITTFHSYKMTSSTTLYSATILAWDPMQMISGVPRINLSPLLCSSEVCLILAFFEVKHGLEVIWSVKSRESHQNWFRQPRAGVYWLCA